MSECEICERNKDTVEDRAFSCYHEDKSFCCFECANIPTCPCSGSEKKSLVENSESEDECAFCNEYQETKSYDFQCGNDDCIRPLCDTCADEPSCSECYAPLLDEEKEWPEDRTTQLN